MPNRPPADAAMHTRSTDGERPLIKREIPLWGILCVLGAFGLQAVSVFYGQQSQSEKLARLEQNLAQINAKFDSIATTQNTSALKDFEHDFKITSLTNRIVALENVMQRQLPAAAIAVVPAQAPRSGK